MSTLKRIVTHPGGAHKDDLLSVCVLIAEKAVPVFRRNPTEEDLNDPEVAVIDIGGEHDPSRQNFDHHHFPREHPPTCSLSLVLDAKGLYQDALQFCDWLEPAEWFDSRGPKKTAEWLGVPRRAISRLNSPIDITLLRRFAAATEHHPGDPLYAYMQMVGEDLVSYLREVRGRLDAVAEHVVRWSLEKDGHRVEAVFLPRTEPLFDEPSSTLASHIRDQGLEETVIAMVYPDRRGEGYGISRYEDHPTLDFTRVEAEADVHFAHKSGFVCKTSATEENRLQELLLGGWRAPE